jgi:hypothetical protein
MRQRIAASASGAPHGVILVFPVPSGAGRAAGIGSPVTG